MKILHEIKNRKNLDVVKIIEKEFEGKTYVDLRLWIPSGTEEIPTRKGFFLTLEEWEGLKAQILKSYQPAEYSIQQSGRGDAPLNALR